MESVRCMIIWVDADSCPRPVRDIIVRGALRTGIETVFVANTKLPGVESGTARLEIVGKEEGAADRFICEHLREGDIVITRDVPLTAEAAEKGTLVLDDRGGIFTARNARERLSVRNAMMEFREAGIMPEYTKKLSSRDLHTFASAFDRVTREKIGNSVDK